MLTPVAGLAVAGLAIAYGEATGKSSSQVLFSGQDALSPLIQQAASYTVGAIVLLTVCKALAYGVSLSGFRGGPIFPAVFVGAAGGIALSHLPGLPLVAGVGMGIGAMTVAMLRLPLTSVLLPTLILQADGLALMPLIIVSVVVAYVAVALAHAKLPRLRRRRLRRRPTADDGPETDEARKLVRATLPGLPIRGRPHSPVRDVCVHGGGADPPRGTGRDRGAPGCDALDDTHRFASRPAPVPLRSCRGRGRRSSPR